MMPPALNTILDFLFFQEPFQYSKGSLHHSMTHPIIKGDDHGRKERPGCGLASLNGSEYWRYDS